MSSVNLSKAATVERLRSTIGGRIGSGLELDLDCPETRCLSAAVKSAAEVSLECLYCDAAVLAVAETTEQSTVLLALTVCESIVDSLSVECPAVAADAGAESTRCSLVTNIFSEYRHLAADELWSMPLTLWQLI